MRTALGAGAAALALLPLAGCADRSWEPESTALVGGYPVQWTVERIAGEHFDAVDLVEAGADPHDAELDVQDRADLDEAALVVHVRGLFPALDEAVDDSRDDEDGVIEAFDVLRTRDAAMGGARPVRVVEGDPHFWLDPRALATLAAEVTERLAELDPEHADDYEESYADLFADLNGLDGRMAAGLDDCERRTVVVGHDAYGYLGYRYDLDLEPISGLSPGAEPSPAHLAELQDLIRRDGITTVFTEELASPELAETLAGSLGLETAVLDPVEGLSDRTEDEDYLSLMEQNLQELRKANQCR